ncbi:MAG: L-rhamnose mutarotase [Sphaerochaeta sp.]|nr:L-rhamnose mutarotase [Sphaerochaeta sp.]
MDTRQAFVMKLKSGCEEEYQRRHAAIWPELKQLLSDSGVYDYSIYFDKDTLSLFAFQRVRGNQGSQDLGTNPIVQKWWAYMADIMETNEDNSPLSIALPELFHMD